MHEAMMLFESLVNGEWFKRKPIILFLNKIDLFKKKLGISPISSHFPDYTNSDNDFDAAARFFADRFRGLNRVPDREIYVHYTNATDTTLLKATMDSVQDMVIQKNLHSLVLYVIFLFESEIHYWIYANILPEFDFVLICRSSCVNVRLCQGNTKKYILFFDFPSIYY